MLTVDSVVTGKLVVILIVEPTDPFNYFIS